MTRDDIIKTAREAGWVIYDDMPYMDVQAIQDALIERLERFAHLIAESEREHCAKECEEVDANPHVVLHHALVCAAAIRSRGKL